MEMWTQFLTVWMITEVMAGNEVPYVVIKDPEKIGVFTPEGRILILLENEYYMLIPVLPNAGWGIPKNGHGPVKLIRW